MIQIDVWSAGCKKQVVQYQNLETTAECKLLLTAGYCGKCAKKNHGRCVK